MNSYRFVILVALKQELPVAILERHSIDVVTLKALRSGFKLEGGSSVLVVVMGVGLDNARWAAEWVKDNLSPYVVCNFGSAGAKDDQLALGNVYRIDDKDRDPFLSQCIPRVSSASIVDMEYLALNEVFDELPFFSFKVITDYDDHRKQSDFKAYLPAVRDQFLSVFNFLFDDAPIHISVVIPTYNRASTIKRAVDSCLNQKKSNRYQLSEIVVVDDGSTDATKKLLSAYGDQILVIELEKNMGVSAARNIGIKQAKSDWIMLLDSDDEWKKDKVVNQVHYLKKHPYFSILQSQEKWIRHGKHLNQKKYHQKKEGWIWEISLERCMISPSSVMLKKDLWKKMGGFDETLPACEDYALWLQITRVLPVGLDPTVSLVKYGGHNDQLSITVPVLDSYRIQALQQMFDSEKNPIYQQQLKNQLDYRSKIVNEGKRKRSS